MMSERFPLARFLYVGGNSETRLKETVPAVPVEMTKRFVVDGVSLPVFNVTAYFFHSGEICETSALANVVAPSLLSMETVRGL